MKKSSIFKNVAYKILSSVFFTRFLNKLLKLSLKNEKINNELHLKTKELFKREVYIQLLEKKRKQGLYHSYGCNLLSLQNLLDLPVLKNSDLQPLKKTASALNREKLNPLQDFIFNFFDKRKGYYIELGAHDGITQSNTYLLEVFKDWKGVLIEPVANLYTSCVLNRSETNNIFRCICSSFEEEMANKSKKITNMGLMSIINDKFNLRNFSNHKVKAEKYINEQGLDTKQEVSLKTLDFLLKSVNAPKNIDLLSLDVEGYELQVLKGINFKDFSFKLIVIEVQKNDYAQINTFMVKNNYEFLKKIDNNFLYIGKTN